MSETDYSCDFMKPLDLVCEADPRNAGTYPDFMGGGQRKIDYFHEKISNFKLIDEIPVDVRIKFETAKNLYIYSWFVYRFFNIAEQQAFTCLEFGLREFFKDEIPNEYKNRYGDIYLGKLLKYTVDIEYIKNDDFEIHRHKTWLSAKQRYESEKLMEMHEKGLGEIILDESEVQIKPEDHSDYLAILLRNLPYLRNSYAHGSSMLHNNVLSTFQLVSEILNSTYQRKLNRELNGSG